MINQPLICCFGEILWDMLPTGKLPGGAPMNVATHLQSRGVPSAMISRVGADDLGNEMKAFLKSKNCRIDCIQTDEIYSTGIVKVYLSEKREATYDIVYPVAWDFIEATPEIYEIVKGSKALVFGTLACRDAHSRAALNTLFELPILKVFDVNIRPPYYSQEIIEEFLQKADIVKMNEDELRSVAVWEGLSELSDQEKLVKLAEKYNLQMLIITQGGDGAMVLDKGDFHKSNGYKVNVVDTIGSGDSFLAGYLKNIFEGKSAAYALTYACALGALVASHAGANPTIEEADILEMMKN